MIALELVHSRTPFVNSSFRTFIGQALKGLCDFPWQSQPHEEKCQKIALSVAKGTNRDESAVVSLTAAEW
jgi:hypothetical protein